MRETKTKELTFQGRRIRITAVRHKVLVDKKGRVSYSAINCKFLDGKSPDDNEIDNYLDDLEMSALCGEIRDALEES